MATGNLIPFLITALMAASISLMLFVARRIDRNGLFDVQAKRVNLLDTDDVRLMVIYSNVTPKARVVKDLTLVYRENGKTVQAVDLTADPFIDRGGENDKMDVDISGHNSLYIDHGSSCSCYYSFRRRGGVKINPKGKIYIRYKMPNGSCRYAEYNPMSTAAQSLRFVRRHWEK